MHLIVLKKKTMYKAINVILDLMIQEDMACVIWSSQSLKSRNVLWFSIFYYDKKTMEQHQKDL